jgi:hypothetical protein
MAGLADLATVRVVLVVTVVGWLADPPHDASTSAAPNKAATRIGRPVPVSTVTATTTRYRRPATRIADRRHELLPG